MPLKTRAFEAGAIDASATPPPAAIYVSRSIGSFSLSGSSGQAIFVWYHEDGTVDGHAHPLKHEGSVALAGTTFDAYAPSGSDHVHGQFLFARAQFEHDEGFRIFYAIHGHLHLWAWDAVRFPAHGG